MKNMDLVKMTFEWISETVILSLRIAFEVRNNTKKQFKEPKYFTFVKGLKTYKLKP